MKYGEEQIDTGSLTDSPAAERCMAHAVEIILEDARREAAIFGRMKEAHKQGDRDAVFLYAGMLIDGSCLDEDGTR